MCRRSFVRHAQRTVSSSQRVAGPAPVGDPEACGDARARTGSHSRRSALGLSSFDARSRTSSFSPRNSARIRCDGSFAERLGKIEVIGELRALGLLAVANGRDERARCQICSRRRADQFGILGEALDQDGAGALQRLLGVGHALVRDPRRPAAAAADPCDGSASSPSASGPSPPPWRSAPWCGASACRADRCPPAAPWCRPRVICASQRVRRACPARGCCRGSALRRSSSSRR